MFKEKSNSFVDYVFWITFIIYTNPGGLLRAIGGDSGGGGADFADFLFIILFGCYVMTFKIFTKEKDTAFEKTKKYIFIYFIYFLVVYGFFTPIFRNSSEYTPLFFLIKNRVAITNIILFVVVYKFFIRSYQIFLKIFILSSLIVIPLFIISVISGIEILPVWEMRRSFAVVKRKLMLDYGLMPFLIPMGAIIFVFNFKVKYKKQILIAFLLLFLSYLLSITRRFIFGAFLVIIIGFFLRFFITKKLPFSLKGVLKASIICIVVIYATYLSFPKYFDAGISAYEETVHIFKYGKNTSGKKDERLGFNRTFIVDLIKKNPFFGTGFDNRWRTKEGDDQGFEAADYPLLSSIAMQGIFGLFFFLPVYILLVRCLYYDLIFFRINRIDYSSFEHYLLISFLLFFIFDLMKYIDWFYVVAKPGDNVWYFLLSLYYGARRVFYNNLINDINYEVNNF